GFDAWRFWFPLRPAPKKSTLSAALGVTWFSSPWEWRPLSLGRPRQMGTKGEKKMYRNNVELIGFLGSDAETKTTANGKTITTLSLATKTSYLKDGDRQEQTEWHRIQAWGRLGEYAAAFRKGAHICVEGEL